MNYFSGYGVKHNPYKIPNAVLLCVQSFFAGIFSVWSFGATAYHVSDTRSVEESIGADWAKLGYDVHPALQKCEEL